MLDPTKIVIRSSTQDFLDIEDIRDDLVLQKDGSASLIIQTTAMNFGLLSEREQDATIYAYAGLLNSLAFPVQIVVRSKRKDVSQYLELLKKLEASKTNELLRFRMKKYREFIESTVKENNVLDKKFYIVISFSSLELGASSSIKSFAKQSTSLPFPKDYIINKAQTALFPKRDHLLRLLSSIGLKGKPLGTRELVELFYSIYNPEDENLKNYDAALSKPLVSPAIAGKGKQNQNPVQKQK